MSSSTAKGRVAAGVAVRWLAMVSGACGLTYEVIWVRSLGLWVGQTTLAVSLVVAAFLGGLVVGSLALGPVADRVRRPLRLFALLELLTGAFGLAVTGLLAWLPNQQSALGAVARGPLVLRVAVGFFLLLPPTLAMGGTLPALTRYVSTRLATVGRSFGYLYSLNTLGAALGCALAGFYLMGRVGLINTAALAALLNVSVALVALLLDGRSDRGSAAAPPEPEPADATTPLPAVLRVPLLSAFVLCGFASISYEVLWFRLLMGFLESTAYALSLLLFTFLLGLVLGGLWYAKRLANHPRPVELLVGVQSGLAFAGLFSLLLLGQSRVLMQLIPGVLRHLGLRNWDYLAMFLHVGLVILVPTFLIGVVFPLVTQLTVPHLKQVGRHVGLLYALNTLGGIAGALLMGFLFIPALGTQRCLLGVCLLNLAVALWVQSRDPGSSWRSRRALLISGALLLFGGLLLPRSYLVRSAAQLSDSRVLEVREGRDGTAWVLQYDRDSVCSSSLHSCPQGSCPAFTHRQLLFGSISYASTVLPARRYMRTLAHIPMLLHPGAKDVLEVCFGTGTTAAAFATHDALRSLTLVDLNPDVFALAPWFSDSNMNVLSDPRVHRLVDDGRHFLHSHAERYDVISFEPPPPIAAGAVSLYSSEFYALVKQRLNPGGLLAQWIPLTQQSDLLNRMLIRSLLEVFPELTLWIPSPWEAVLIASDSPHALDLAQWRRRLEESPRVQANLADVGFDGPEQLLGSYLMGTEALRRYTEGVRPVSDNFPAVEYFLSFGDRPFSSADLLAAAPPAGPLVEGTDAESQLKVQTAARSQRMLWGAFDASLDGHMDEARQRLAVGRKLGGETAYTRFMETLEFGCLANKQSVR